MEVEVSALIRDVVENADPIGRNVSVNEGLVEISILLVLEIGYV